jgi:glutamate-1-semialdehyde 2,1-aminomutase
MKHDRNRELTERFNDYYPGGHTNFRVPVHATQNRVFMVRAQGSRLWDADGNEYIDYMGAMGPTILGHRHPEMVRALKEYLDVMPISVGSGVFPSVDDVEVAEKLVKHVPCAEQIKFNLSGSEAVQLAFRLARAHTGRPRLVRFGGHYHGWADNVLGGTVNPKPTDRPFPVEDPASDWFFTAGKYPEAGQESFLLPWNDAHALESTLKKWGDEVAVVHLEALVCNHFCLMPRPGFLKRVRDLCTRYNVVLSFDEVITGFRLGLGGAQEYFGVTPDIATFGKALAGGVPCSAVMGRARIMEHLGRTENKVLGPGTFNGYPFGMRAVLTTLRILERDHGSVYAEMARIQRRLMDGLSDLARTRSIPMRVQGATGVFFTIFGLDPDRVAYTHDDLARIDFGSYMRFWQGMQEQGIIILAGGRWYMSIAHTDGDVDRTLEAADKVMSSL